MIILTTTRSTSLYSNSSQAVRGHPLVEHRRQSAGGTPVLIKIIIIIVIITVIIIIIITVIIIIVIAIIIIIITSAGRHASPAQVQPRRKDRVRGGAQQTS